MSVTRDFDSDHNVSSLLETLALKQRHERKWLLVVSLSLMAAATLVATLVVLQLGRQAQASLAVAQQQTEALRTLQDEKSRVERELTRQAQIRRAFSEAIERGVTNAQAGRLTPAISAYEEALTLDPESEQAHALKGYALLRRGQITKARNPSQSREDIAASVRSFEEGLGFNDTSVWGHYNLALAYWENGDKTRAIEQITRVLELDPTFKETIKGDIQFNKFRTDPAFEDLMNDGRPERN